MIKLIALDFDGTLVPKKIVDAHIHKKILELLKIIKNKGVVLMLATGRHPSYILKRVPEFRFDWIVGYSGNIIYQNSVVESEKFSNSEIEIFQSYFIKNFDTDIILYNSEAIAFVSSEVDYQWLLKRYSRKDKIVDLNGVSDKRINDLLKTELDFSICRVCVVMNDLDKLYKVKNRFNEDFEEYRLVKTGNRQVELLRKNTSKASEILKIADRLGIEKSEIAVIGDDENDKEMLEMFKNSFYVGEGSEYLSEIASYSCTNCYEALKKIVED